MKFISTKENFLKVVSLAGQVVAPKPSLPVLGSFFLSAKTGFLEVIATDLETTINLKFPVKVEREGNITVPAKILIDFCQGAAGENLTLEAIKDNVLLKIGNSTATLPSISPEEFPTTHQFDTSSTITLDKTGLMEGASSISFCASPDIGRPVLSGVLFKTENKNLCLVATDGYRLAKKELKAKENLEAIVPARALSEIIRALASQEDETVEVSTDKEGNQIRFQVKNLVVTTRLLEGDYPSYSQIIPDSSITDIEVGTKVLADAIKLASFFARDVGNVVRFETTSKGLKISASTTQVGETETEITARCSGEPLKIAFNSRFLIEGLAAIKNEEVKLSFSGITSAALLQGNKDPSLIYVVMPVRIQS